MASETENITAITRGNDVTLKFNITTSVDLASARLMIKRKIRDLDADATINKLVTTDLTADGQLTDVGGVDNIAVAEFFLTKTETDDFQAGKDYQYDLEVEDEDGNFTTPVGGTIQLEERVRTAVG